MNNLKDSTVDEIVNTCLKHYNSLPKTGKPIEKEWTVLSCIVEHKLTNNSFDVVSLGTGSKCVGASKMSSTGDIMNDSHAEVFARRGFLLYLYDNIEKSIGGTQSIFDRHHGKFKLKDDIEFVFYSSQLPCGDACIIPMTDSEFFGDIVLSKKRTGDTYNSDIEIKKQKLNDVHRTGAKCLEHSKQDPKTDSSYHLVGQVRTKPGRGDRTLSISCSDKIARWIHLGIQGGLLNMLLYEPIFIKHFVFGYGVPYSEESINRAFLNRCGDISELCDVVPQFYRSTVTFPCIRNELNARPAAGSIVWSKSNNSLPEVAVQGKKLGATKKKLSLPANSLCISKYNIYRTFLNILSKEPDLKESVCGNENVNYISYSEMKRKSISYLDKWSKVKSSFFKTWTIKPDMWNFCVK